MNTIYAAVRCAEILLKDMTEKCPGKTRQLATAAALRSHVLSVSPSSVCFSEKADQNMWIRIPALFVCRRVKFITLCVAFDYVGHVAR